jgi:hypothetical protein
MAEAASSDGWEANVVFRVGPIFFEQQQKKIQFMD